VSGIATRPLYLDVAVPRASRWEHAVPAGHSALCYVFEGRGEMGVTEADAGRSVGPCQLAVLGPGEGLAVVTRDSPVRFLLLAARPLEEPVVRHGPFVMNTKRATAPS